MSGARRRQSLPQFSDLSGYIESWDFTNSAKRWQDLARTTQAIATGDPVSVLDPDSDSNRSALRLTNPNSYNRPLVSAGGIIFDGNDDYFYASATGLAAETGGLTIAMRIALTSTPDLYDGVFSLAPMTGLDYLAGIAHFWDNANSTDHHLWSAAFAGSIEGESIGPFSFGEFVTIQYFAPPTGGTGNLYINGSLVSSSISTTATFYPDTIGVACRLEPNPTKFPAMQYHKLAIFAGNRAADVATITAIMGT